jgi:hypothetical protein
LGKTVESDETAAPGGNSLDGEVDGVAAELVVLFDSSLAVQNDGNVDAQLFRAAPLLGFREREETGQRGEKLRAQGREEVPTRVFIRAWEPARNGTAPWPRWRATARVATAARTTTRHFHT